MILTDFYSSVVHCLDRARENIISGLLAAHLLGREFRRIVCILPEYTAFLAVFESIHNVEQCSRLLQSSLPGRSSENDLQINYLPAPNECTLQSKLSSSERILHFTGNTYPSWPAIRERFFLQHYRPKPDLLNALPYKVYPTTVVHLRERDSVHVDFRSGLDPASLDALGKLLPKGPSTYLVTNRVALYEQFEHCCQWSQPPWNTVIHSAKGLHWGAVYESG